VAIGRRWPARGGFGLIFSVLPLYRKDDAQPIPTESGDTNETNPKPLILSGIADDMSLTSDTGPI
jgi:hypothetical protein